MLDPSYTDLRSMCRTAEVGATLRYRPSPARGSDSHRPSCRFCLQPLERL